MAEIHLCCGKICAGKSWLARQIKQEYNGVILSCDEIMTLFPPLDGDEKYAETSEKVKKYLLGKASDILQCGTDVILDWGFWKKAERQAVTAYFEAQDIPVHWYYLDISDEAWQRNIARRNACPGPSDYFVDEGLREKCLSRFEPPAPEETQGWTVIRK